MFSWQNVCLPGARATCLNVIHHLRHLHPWAGVGGGRCLLMGRKCPSGTFRMAPSLHLTHCCSQGAEGRAMNFPLVTGLPQLLLGDQAFWNLAPSFPTPSFASCPHYQVLSFPASGPTNLSLLFQYTLQGSTQPWPSIPLEPLS